MNDWPGHNGVMAAASIATVLCRTCDRVQPDVYVSLCQWSGGHCAQASAACVSRACMLAQGGMDGGSSAACGG